MIYIKINKVVLSDEITKSKRGENVVVEAILLGLIFFNDPKFNNATPGRIADIFFSRPLNLLEKTFSFMTFFAVFISIAKVILLIVCLWICGKIISIYISNIFMALMLTTFSIFYLLFLTMEDTAQIGHRGINTIIVQSVTLFMTVAMMGISYQVMRLIAVGDSISGIASMTVILFMLEQVIENISGMAVAITSGGGLGQSKGDAFLQLTGAFGAIAGGLAIMGGAKLDELKEGNTKDTESELFSKENNAKEDNNSSKYSDKEIIAKANRNVENEASGRYSGSSSNSSNTSDNGLGVRYNKGRGVPKNFKKAEDSFRDYKNMKKNSGLGINSKIGLGVALFLQAGTSDLSKIASYKDLINGIKDATGSNNYPYNVMSRTEQIGKAGANLFKNGLNNLKNDLLSVPDLNPEMGSMNEAVRGNAYNYENQSSNSNNESSYSPIINSSSQNGYSNNNTTLLMNDLEKINRNNPNKIVSQYTNSEEIENIARNATEEFYKRIKENK